MAMEVVSPPQIDTSIPRQLSSQDGFSALRSVAYIAAGAATAAAVLGLLSLAAQAVRNCRASTGNASVDDRSEAKCILGEDPS
mmetsp:Transcript_88440/g.175854  ORF Transcript_88440/g.175854 Transcript_88440/m.175854 type:complete len:83 (+) Transcript_88440:63-311(+)